MKEKHLVQNRSKTYRLKPLGFVGFIILSLFAVFMLTNPGQQAASSALTVVPAAETNVPMPQLDGEKATEYLKEQGLYSSLGQAMEATRYSVNPATNPPLENQDEALEAGNPRQGFTTYFANDGVHLVSNARDDNWQISMSLRGYGYGEDIIPVEQTEMNVQKNKSRIEILKTGTQDPNSKITEWYENSPAGLEQGWTIAERPLTNTTSGELRLALDLAGDLKARIAADNQKLSFVGKDGRAVLNYDKLKSWDADGKELASRMELANNDLSIVVNDENARYPITIDPLVTQTETSKLTASDGASNDQFGVSVAISGDTAIVGANLDDDAGLNSGAAYIYVRSGTNTWTEQEKLTASDGASDDFFGQSVAISGDTAIVGANGDDDAGSNSGSAYVYVRSGTSWVEQVKLTASDAAAGHAFGVSVAISGNTAVVGANLGNAGLTSATGSAYIYVRSGPIWTQQAKLTALDAAVADQFGFRVAISGNTAIVGARNDDDPIAGINSGSAYVYLRSGTTWTQQAKLTASDAAVGDQFGGSVAISGDTALVGASGDDDAGSNSGSAYFYVRSGPTWTQQQKVIASDGTTSENYGISVAISGGAAIVGVWRGNNTGIVTGSAFIYVRSGTNTWTEQSKLVASDGASGDLFGFPVAISGDTAIVGAPLGDGNVVNSGSAYVFTFPTSKLIASDGALNDFFGNWVAISGDTAIVGAPADDGNIGSAYVYVRSGPSWVEQQKLTASDGLSPHRFGTSVAISGDTVIVGAVNGTGNATGTGAAYVFVRSVLNSTWSQQSKLIASDGLAADQFGSSVAISGDTAVVGASRGDGSALNSGSAYVYVRSGTTWTQQSELTAADGAALDDFGLWVAISGDTTIVAARSDDDAGISSGSAYIYVRSGTSWAQQQKLTASDAAAGDLFGRSVAISRDTVIIAATMDDDAGSNSGSAYIYVRSGTSWTQQQKLLASDGAIDDWFGYTVALSGETAIVMAPRLLSSGIGEGYVYVRNGTTWTEQSNLTASDAAVGDQFGFSVAVSGNTAIVGAPGDDDTGSSSGGAYVFTVPITLNKATPGVMYASTGIADGGRLLTVDLNTGAGTLVGSTDRPNVADIAIDSGGDIFAVETRSSSTFYRLDAATAIAQFVGNTGDRGVESLAFDENGVLYGSGQFSGQKLFIIDPVSGATTVVGPTEPDMVGLAFDPTNGTLYASQGRGRDNIYTLDKTTGTATLVGTTGLGGSTPSIAFDAAGNLYGVKGGGQGPNNLISINKATGQGTVIGPVGFSSVSGLSFAAPPNAAPTANAGGPYSGDFGSDIAMGGATASDPDMDMLTYSWTVNSASCSFDDPSALNPDLTCNATGNFTATLEVSDGVNPPVSSDAAVMVNKAATTTTVTCPAGSYTYTGSAQTPCSASVTGPGGLNLTPTPDYANNTDAGTANASYTYAESANYLGSSDSENFTINKAGLTVTPDAQQILIGSPDPTFTFSYAGFVNGENPGVLDTAPTCGVTGVHTGVGSYTITCSGGVDNNYSFTYAAATLTVVYNFNGFLDPIDNLNQNNVKAGQGIPVKFSLNGNFGLNILAAGYPVSYQVPCSGTGDNGEEIPTVTAGNSSLSYDATTDQYNYVWKTDKNWAETCRVLVVQLNDGSFHTASFKFK